MMQRMPRATKGRVADDLRRCATLNRVQHATMQHAACAMRHTANKIQQPTHTSSTPPGRDPNGIQQAVVKNGTMQRAVDNVQNA
jgi:hypothetical protein